MLSVKSKAVMEKMLVPWCSSTGSRCAGRMRPRVFGRELEEAADGVADSRIGSAPAYPLFAQHARDHAHRALELLPRVCAAETEMRRRDLCFGTAG